MEGRQKNLIVRNLKTLIENTNCTVELLSKLCADGILSPEEVETLQMESLSGLQKSQKLYTIVQTRRDGFNLLKLALSECKQTGAYDILNQVNDAVVSRGEVYCGSISYDRQAIIGTGSKNTKVFKGRAGGRDVAVKLISRENVDEHTALEEVKRLRQLDWHENIVRLFDTKSTDNHILIALELCSIDLDGWVKSIDKSSRISIDPVDILRQATKGIQHLHNNNIIHMDVKPANILIATLSCGDVKVKISDFGISEQVYDDTCCLALESRTFGSVAWSTPEMAKTMYLEPKSNAAFKLYPATDVFALGCVFYFVLTDGQHPFGENYRRLGNIIDYKYSLKEDQLKCLENGAFSLIHEMIREHPSDRLSSSEILLHHLFWSKENSLQFLSDIISVWKANPNDTDFGSLFSASVEISVESHCVMLSSHENYKNWLEKVSEPVKSFLIEKKSSGANAIDLVETIIYLSKNYTTLPEAVQIELGRPPEEFCNYWFTRFSNLVQMAWSSHQNLRNHPNLEKYYPKKHTFKNPFEKVPIQQEGSPGHPIEGQLLQEKNDDEHKNPRNNPTETTSVNGFSQADVTESENLDPVHIHLVQQSEWTAKTLLFVQIGREKIGVMKNCCTLEYHLFQCGWSEHFEWVFGNALEYAKEAYGEIILELYDLGSKLFDFHEDKTDRMKGELQCGDIAVDAKAETAFLLALFFRSIRQETEAMMITVPCWLPSFQRQIVLDAAEIAGFDLSNVTLFSENSAAAYHMYESRSHEHKYDTIVLSENSGILDISFYSYDYDENKLLMLSHSDEYETQTQMVAYSNDSPSWTWRAVDKSEEEVMQKMQTICEKTIEKAKRQKFRLLSPKIKFLICCQSKILNRMLFTVATKFAYSEEYITVKNDAPIFGLASMHQVDLDKVGVPSKITTVIEKMLCNVYIHFGEEKRRVEFDGESTFAGNTTSVHGTAKFPRKFGQQVIYIAQYCFNISTRVGKLIIIDSSSMGIKDSITEYAVTLQMSHLGIIKFVKLEGIHYTEKEHLPLRSLVKQSTYQWVSYQSVDENLKYTCMSHMHDIRFYNGHASSR